MCDYCPMTFYANWPRVYVILRGGLGNQLHQIAAAVAFADKVGNHVRVFSNIVDHANNPARRGFYKKLELKKVFYTVKVEETNKIETFLLKLFNRLNLPILNSLIISEKQFHLDIKPRLMFIIKGYFQSNEFLPMKFNLTRLTNIAKLKTGSVTIHIRLTDFSEIDSNPLDSDYYLRAIYWIKKSYKIDKIICYSDDLTLAREMLQSLTEVEYPEEVQELNPDQLLSCLSDAEFLICSKSTLCWWAAKIVSEKGGLVISPWAEKVHSLNWFQVEQ